MTNEEPDIYITFGQNISKAYPLNVFVVMREVFIEYARSTCRERKLSRCLVSCAALHQSDLIITKGQRQQFFRLNAGDGQSSNQRGLCHSVVREIRTVMP
jgi:hypothetical protein